MSNIKVIEIENTFGFQVSNVIQSLSQLVCVKCVESKMVEVTCWKVITYLLLITQLRQQDL